MKKRGSLLLRRLLTGTLTGLIGGLVFGVLVKQEMGFGTHLIVSAGLGLIFGLVCGAQVQTAGAGLIWGAAFGMIWWLTGVLTILPILTGEGLRWTLEAAGGQLQFLLGDVAVFGGLTGLLYFFLFGMLQAMLPRGPEANPTSPCQLMERLFLPVPLQAIVLGGSSGLAGSWVFLRGIETSHFFPLVANMVGSDSMMVGGVLHYTISIVIGISFGLLFDRETTGVGTGMIWGLAYGLFWWILGPLTLAGWIMGAPLQPDWSLATAAGVVPELVAHLIYGIIVGLFYAAAQRVWQALFVDSDPLNRTREGLGGQGIRGILLGQAGGLVGGLLFAIVMVGINALPRVARLMGADSTSAGLIVHLLISIAIGSTFGLFFQRESQSFGNGLGWGILYGLVWWLVGANTLFNVLLHQPVDWSREAVAANYPSLVGHLLYGAGLGLFFQHLARRTKIGRSTSRGRAAAPQSPGRGASGQTASALWVVTLVLGVLLPLLFARP